MEEPIIGLGNRADITMGYNIANMLEMEDTSVNEGGGLIDNIMRLEGSNSNVGNNNNGALAENEVTVANEGERINLRMGLLNVRTLAEKVRTQGGDEFF